MPRRPRLDEAWLAWAVEAILGGASRESVIATLVAQGAPPALARRDVAKLSRSRALTACRALLRQRDRARAQLALLAKLESHAELPFVQRRAQVSAAEFFDRYWAGSRPVVLTDVVPRWKAFTSWTFEALTARFGDLEIEVMADRDTNPTPELDLARHRRRMRLRDLIERVLGAGPSNDLYLVSRNRALMDTPLGEILDDVDVDPAMFDPARLRSAAALWIGPAGTRTPLHHDATNILFCQIRGAKRISLVSPRIHEMFEHAHGVYGIDCDDPRFAEMGDVPVHVVELAEGEALFLPAGWWHQVVSTTPSISLGVMPFRRPNTFDYRPGILWR